MRSQPSRRASAGADSADPRPRPSGGYWIVGTILILMACILVLAVFGPGGMAGFQFNPNPATSTPAGTAAPQPTATQDADWVVTFEYLFPTQTWAQGEHQYVIESSCPSFSAASGRWTAQFEVAQGASFHSGYVYLRTRGISVSPRSQTFLQSIHPDQPLAASFRVALPDLEMANLIAVDCSVVVSLDGASPQQLLAGDPLQR